jgi:hypothetical protein
MGGGCGAPYVLQVCGAAPPLPAALGGGGRGLAGGGEEARERSGGAAVVGRAPGRRRGRGAAEELKDADKVLAAAALDKGGEEAGDADLRLSHGEIAVVSHGGHVHDAHCLPPCSCSVVREEHLLEACTHARSSDGKNERDRFEEGSRNLPPSARKQPHGKCFEN